MIPSERYKALYDYQEKQFNYAKERYFKLEEKSFRYLTFLTIVISVYTLVLKSSFEIEHHYSFSLYILNFLLILSIVSLSSAWSFIFRSLKLMNIPVPAYDEKLIDFFRDTEHLESVYQDRAKKFHLAIKDFEIVNKEKINLIEKAYSEISFGIWCFVIFISLLLILKV